MCVGGYSSLLLEGIYRVCVVCDCLCILMSKTYCVVFRRLACPILPVSLDCLSISRSVFCDVYLRYLVDAYIVQCSIML
jgi:hypothetical protein